MKAFLGFRGLFLLSLMWTCAGDWSAVQVQCSYFWFYAKIKPTIFHNIYMAPDEAFLGDYCAVTRFEPDVFYEFFYHSYDCGIITKILQETLLLKTKIKYISKISNNQAEMPLSCVVHHGYRKDTPHSALPTDGGRMMTIMAANILLTYYIPCTVQERYLYEGNYYSLRSQHEKAALYFQRALKLNPRYLGAWTLMGHEYMEMKNTSAAIQAYRHAIEVNKRDYRAWYGLGQTYEILKMPFYCLYYYRRAHQLRPNDSRMLVALGECYEKLNQLVEAKKCYWRAYAVGDVEKMALVKLAKLHEQLTESEQAAQCYIKYIQDIYSCGEIVEHLEESTAFRYLAQYYFKCKLWDEASACAQKCCAFNDTREEGKALLRQILQLRNQGETPTTEMPAPFFLPASLSTNTTPTRRVSPLNLSSVTP